MFKNEAINKEIFTLWLHFQDKLYTSGDCYTGEWMLMLVVCFVLYLLNQGAIFLINISLSKIYEVDFFSD